jgi:SAM-dependent methyltransferase
VSAQARAPEVDGLEPAPVTSRGKLLAALRCPACRAPLGEHDAGVTCSAGHEVRDGGGWLDLAASTPDRVTGRTFDSFGYEWNRFAEIQPEDEGYWQSYTADVPWDELRDGLGADIGCGKGRYSRPTARRIGALVALDGSDAVSAAARNLGDEPNVVVVRADLRDGALADGEFDFVSCLGVLHHLPEPRPAFLATVRLLKPGGVLLVYLYSRPEGGGLRAQALRSATALRRVTTRVPHQVLRPACFPLAAALFLAFVLPGAAGRRLGWRALDGLPLAVYRGSPVRSLWLDTFDRLSAPVEHRYTWEEVRPWFEEAGLDVLAARTWGGLMITARKR